MILFNSQIKIDKDRFYAVDSENTLHCFSLKNGNKIWSYKTENFFIKSNRKLSIVIDNDKVEVEIADNVTCLLYTSPSPRDRG